MARSRRGSRHAHIPPEAPMPYSASCPSLSAMYDGPDELLRALADDDRAVHGGQSAGNLMAALAHDASGLGVAPAVLGLQPAGLHLDEEPLGEPSTSAELLGPDKGYDFLLQLQQDHLDASQRLFPHQAPAFLNDDVDGLLVSPPAGNAKRAGFHGSASFTNLASMEAELQRRQQAASKRKKGGSERWHKLQRHKSFDSTVMPELDFTQPSFSAPPGSNFFGPNAPPIAMPSSIPNAVPFMQSSANPDADMLGMEDFPTNFTSEPSWPATSMALGGGMMIDAFGGADEASLINDMNALAASSPHDPDGFMRSMAAATQQVPDDSNVQSSAALDLLLSEKERDNMFDAIRDFSAPNESAVSAAMSTPLSSSAPTTSYMDASPRERRGVMRRRDSRNGVMGKRKTTHSPPLHPYARNREDSNHGKPFSLNSGSPPTGLPPQRPQEPPSVPMRKRLEQILVHSVQNSDAGAMLSVIEMEFLKQSPLFSADKAAETAGSLWLLLHAAQCDDSSCEIGGCDVMRRVLSHCMGCDLLVGKCKQPCNDAKAMLLHYGSCNSKGSMHGKSCAVCWNLLEIDHAHQAALDNSGKPAAPPAAPMMSTTPPVMGGTPLLPMPMNPLSASSFVSPSLRPSAGPNASSGGSSTSKHVPIQPNPLPTASNPMGLMGSFPHFGYSLSLYLEQTSAPFRAEVKSRVEKRVTAAASQDLIQHMQKKTRLRSLDDLRSEARTIVLGEMERELHFHMQAYSWATASGKSMGDPSATYPGGMPGDNALPPYLLSVAAAGFAALYAQQATLQAAAMTSGRPAQPATSASSSGPSRRKSDASSKKKKAEGEPTTVAS